VTRRFENSGPEGVGGPFFMPLDSTGDRLIIHRVSANSFLRTGGHDAGYEETSDPEETVQKGTQEILGKSNC
jgi:hypothetical protein